MGFEPITDNANANASSESLRKRNIQVTQPFSGDKVMDAAQWLRIFERNAKRQGVPEAEMAEEAISYLVGAAEQWYTDECERERIRPEATWAQWKIAFVGKYVEVETAMELLESLLQVNQEKGESVEEYGTRVKDLVRKVGREASTGVVLVVFKKGLLPSYQMELEKSEYKTLDGALSIVTKKERMTKIERKAIIEEKSVTKDDVDKLADKLDKMKLRLMHAEAVAKKNNACYNCFEPGHTSSECPSRTGRRTAKKFEKEKEKTNGKVERFNGTLCQQLGKMAYDREDDWSKCVDPMLFSYRMKINEVTGKSPYEMLYGVSPKLSKWIMRDYGLDENTKCDEDIDEIRELGIKESVEVESQFELNDLVMLKNINPSKLKPKWNSYCKIVAIGPNNSYQLGLENGKQLPNWVNGRRIQRYRLN